MSRRKLKQKQKQKQTTRVSQKVSVKIGDSSRDKKYTPTIQYIPMPQYIPQYIQQNVPQLTKEDVRTLIRSEIPDRVRFETFTPLIESKETMPIPIMSEEKSTMFRPKVKTIETETEPFNVGDVSFESLRTESLPSQGERIPLLEDRSAQTEPIEKSASSLREEFRELFPYREGSPFYKITPSGQKRFDKKSPALRDLYDSIFGEGRFEADNDSEFILKELQRAKRRGLF